MVASVGDARNFRNGRHLAAWLWLVLRQHSTGGKSLLLGISKHVTVWLAGSGSWNGPTWSGNLDDLVEMEVTINGNGYVFRGQTPGVTGKVFQACGAALRPVLRSC